MSTYVSSAPFHWVVLQASGAQAVFVVLLQLHVQLKVPLGVQDVSDIPRVI